MRADCEGEAKAGLSAETTPGPQHAPPPGGSSWPSACPPTHRQPFRVVCSLLPVFAWLLGLHLAGHPLQSLPLAPPRVPGLLGVPMDLFSVYTFRPLVLNTTYVPTVLNLHPTPRLLFPTPGSHIHRPLVAVPGRLVARHLRMHPFLPSAVDSCAPAPLLERERPEDRVLFCSLAP